MNDSKVIAELTIEATLDNINKALEFVENILEEKDVSMKDQISLSIAIDEIVSNIIKYAYTPEIGTATVRVSEVPDGKMLELTFIDTGVPYNPLENEDPDVTLSLDERQAGGLGIFIVKESMDDVFYKHEDGKNIFTIRKKLA